MTGFDNGPADGDFVRYIDGLLAARVVEPPRNPSVAPSFMVPNASSRRDEAGSPRRTSRAERATPTQAAAIAAAMLRNQGPADAKIWIPIAAVLLGAAIVVYGWIGAASGAPFVFVGFALAYWAGKRLAGSGRAGLRGPSIRTP